MDESLAVRGTLRVHVDELSTGDVARAELREYLVGAAVPLSRLREALSGDAGEIIDEFGDAHELPIEEWANRPPETLLTIYFTFQQSNAPTGLRGSTYPADVLELVRAPS